MIFGVVTLCFGFLSRVSKTGRLFLTQLCFFALVIVGPHAGVMTLVTFSIKHSWRRNSKIPNRVTTYIMNYQNLNVREKTGLN